MPTNRSSALATGLQIRAVTRQRAPSFRLDAGELNHLGPLRDLVDDLLREVGGRARQHGAAKLDKLRADLAISEPGVGGLVELVDDLGRCALGRADAEQAARLIARKEFGHRRNVRQYLEARGRGNRERPQLARSNELEAGGE